MRANNICQIRNIFRSDVGCWRNIEELNNKLRSSLNLVVRQNSSHSDCISPCSNLSLCINLKLWLKPVKIYYLSWRLRDGRYWINFVPIFEYVIANYWRKGKIRVKICLFWIVNDIFFIRHWICHDILIAAKI